MIWVEFGVTFQRFFLELSSFPNRYWNPSEAGTLPSRGFFGQVNPVGD